MYASQHIIKKIIKLVLKIIKFVLKFIHNKYIMTRIVFTFFFKSNSKPDFSTKNDIDKNYEETL